MSKATLRTLYRSKRQKIRKRYKEEATIHAATLLSEQSLFQQSQQIACYLPNADEFDTWAIIKLIWITKKHCYLPVLSAERSLHFFSYAEGDTLKANRYGILEPIEGNAIAVNELQIIVIPLLAFDLQGNRLGTGGGYYDRTLATLSHQIKKPMLIGLGFASQEHEGLPSDPWDVKLNAVLTEKGFTWLD